MSNPDTEALEGITLSVYLYVAKKGKPVGPRDVMKGVKPQQPKRRLQASAETRRFRVFTARTSYGEYTVKRQSRRQRARLGWSPTLPKMWLYALVFLGILIVEFLIFLIHFSVETYEFKVFFLLLTLITGLAFAVFTVEGALSRRKTLSVATE